MTEKLDKIWEEICLTAVIAPDMPIPGVTVEVGQKLISALSQASYLCYC